MNAYGSVLRSYLASNVIQSSMAAPAPLVVTPVMPVAQYLQAGGSVVSFPVVPGTDDWNRQSNIIIRRAGLFSNFADGLVQLTPGVRPTLVIEAKGFTRAPTPITGTVSTVPGTRNILGVGTLFNTELVVGETYILRGHHLVVTAIADDLNAQVNQYAGISGAVVNGVMFYAAVNGLMEAVRVPGILSLNYMHELEEYVGIAALGGITPSDSIGLLCSVSLSESLSFGTIGVDTAWNTSPVVFDIQLDIEITPR